MSQEPAFSNFDQEQRELGFTNGSTNPQTKPTDQKQDEQTKNERKVWKTYIWLFATIRS